MTKYHIATWSGGKDSTYMVDELLRREDPLDEIIFMDTSYEFDIMYDYIEKVSEYWEKKYPDCKITKLNYGKGREIWESWSETPYTKGINEGKLRGFPYFMGMSWCTRELKVAPLQKYLKKYEDDYDVIHYVGIAFDEPKRVKENGEVYPLVNWKITEREAAEILVERGLHNPLYNHFHRTGCFMCPKQSFTSLYKLWVHYPKEWQIIVEMEEAYKKGDYAIHDYREIGTKALLEKFKKYEAKGKPTNYLDDEQPIGCFCK